MSKRGSLRRQEAALRRGTLVELLADEKAYAYARVLDGRAVVCAFNTSAEPVAVDVPAAPASLAAGLHLRDAIGAAAEARVEDGADGPRLRLTLPPRSAAVFVPVQ